MAKQYWSQRKGLTAKYNFSDVKIAIKTIVDDFTNRGYFQEYYGYSCVDAEDNFSPGKAGYNIPNFIFTRIKRRLEWPLNIEGFDVDTLFDIVELYYDTISYPVKGHYHEYMQCGHHYSSFDTAKGQEEYRKAINEILADYENGYELTNKGEIVLLLTPGLSELTSAQIPININEETKIKNKVEWAVKKYRDWHSTIIDRREAVRELADVLEYLKPVLQSAMLTADEKALGNIANNFSIRHNNKNQKEEYGPVWLNWIFYLYLSTIHLCLRLRQNLR
jgi:hypothetical protein